MDRLSNETLGALPEGVARPAYDRSQVPARIVHLGTGAFHRAHQAFYTHQLMQQGGAHWGTFSVSLRNPAISQALAPQDGLYTLLIDDNGARQAHIVGSLNRVVCLANERQAVLDQLASPQTELVTLTVTEKGYSFDAATGTLNEDLSEIKLDLASPQSARSAVGILAWSIHQRKQKGLKPFTLLSCDHLVNNGKVLQRVLEHYIERVQHDLNDTGLLQYFLNEYACPCSMVDRIIPPVTANDMASTDGLLGLHDAAPVVTEPFSQWVIQDWFSAGRPKWENVGATLAVHIDPYRQLSERLLDASYLAIGCLGGIAGYRTAASAMQDPEISRFVGLLMDEAAVTLTKHTGIDWQAYKQAWLQRFGNASLNLLTAQLAADGSGTLPLSILEPVKARLLHGLDIDRHAMVVAAFIRYLMGRGERREDLLVNDPLQPQLAQAIAKAGDNASANDLVDAVLSVREIFGDKLPQNLEFVRSVAAALQSLLSDRVAGGLAALNAPDPA